MLISSCGREGSRLLSRRENRGWCLDDEVGIEGFMWIDRKKRWLIVREVVSFFFF